MREQPGFVSSRLHRALAPDARFRFINMRQKGTLACYAASRRCSDGFRPDRYDLIGASACLIGVAIIMYSPR